MDEYSAKIASVLKLAPLEQEAEGAEFVVRVLFKPSFDPECAVTLLAQVGKAELTISSALRSVWAYFGALRGAHFGSTVAFVEPAAAIERVEVPRAAVTSLQSAVHRALESPWLGKGLGIDGLPTRLELHVGRGSMRTLDLWLPGNAETEPGVVCRLMRDLAREHGRWKQTQSALTVLDRYSP